MAHSGLTLTVVRHVLNEQQVHHPNIHLPDHLVDYPEPCRHFMILILDIDAHTAEATICFRTIAYRLRFTLTSV